MKMKWKVEPEPTGRYRSFSHRGWPSATYPNGDFAGSIRCEDDYSGKRAKGLIPHKPLKVYVKVRCKTEEDVKKYGTFQTRRLLGEFATLPEAKAALERWCTLYPQTLPVEDTSIK